MAIDPAAGRIYWANFGSSNTISYANLNGSGGGDINTMGAITSGPDLPALLESPSRAGAPTVTGTPAPGSTLRCAHATWAPDLLSSLLYRAPQSFAYGWTEGGQPIAGATGSSITARSVDDYRCRVTATNHAGSADQASHSYSVFKVGRPRLNRNKGTARLRVRVPDAGSLTLSGKGIVKQRPVLVRGSRTLAREVGAGTAKLLVRVKGKARKRLIRKGKARVKVKVTYEPRGGTQEDQTKPVKLKKKLRR